MRHRTYFLPLTFLLLVPFLSASAQPADEVAENPLEPVKTDNPRDTMESFLNAMNDYRRGLETRDPEQLARLDAAVQCLNLGDTNLLLQQEQGREAAIFLKETIDRVIVIDLDLIPEGSGDPENPLLVWRLRNTDIRIGRVEEGERAGEYLFTPRTVRNARYYYQKVQDLPYLEGSGQGAGYREPLLERVAPEWMRSQYLFLPLWQWIGIALAIFLGLGLKVLVSWAVDLIAKFAARSESSWDDLLIHAISPPLGYVAAAALWYLALGVLRLDGVALSVASVALQLFLRGEFVEGKVDLCVGRLEWSLHLSHLTSENCVNSFGNLATVFLCSIDSASGEGILIGSATGPEHGDRAGMSALDFQLSKSGPVS